MPELPEVEVARRHLERCLKGQQVVAVELVDNVRMHGEPETLAGRTCLGWRRHGKVLMGDFDGGVSLLSHLGMTGKWVDDGPSRRHRRLVLRVCDGSSVVLIDPRRFGRAWFGPTEALETLDCWAQLGPDALQLVHAPGAGERLGGIFGSKRSPLKRRLLDQTGVAGFGNISVIESCWRARIHPHVACDTLTLADWRRLADAARGHFTQVIEVEGAQELTYVSESKAANPFLVYGRGGQPCPRCGEALDHGHLSKRPSVWCSTCQPPVV